MSIRSWIRANDGAILSLKHWGMENSRHILCIHGWLDNVESFSYLAPRLAQIGYSVTAVDLPGHGLSSHLSRDAHYSIYSNVMYVQEIAKHFQWDTFSLLSHSFGGAISILYASAYPENLQRLIVLDSGLVARSETGSAANLRSHCDFRISNPETTSSKQYETLDRAIEARIEAVRRHAGEQKVSREAASAIVQHGCQLVSGQSLVGSAEESEDPDIRAYILSLKPSPTLNHEGPVTFRHDPRLYGPPAVQATETQANAFVDSIRCPMLFVMATHGWPQSAYWLRQLDRLSNRQDCSIEHVNGHHHLHLDPDSAGAVCDKVKVFLETDFMSMRSNL